MTGDMGSWLELALAQLAAAKEGVDHAIGDVATGTAALRSAVNRVHVALGAEVGGTIISQGPALLTEAEELIGHLTLYRAELAELISVWEGE